MHKMAWGTGVVLRCAGCAAAAGRCARGGPWCAPPAAVRAGLAARMEPLVRELLPLGDAPERGSAAGAPPCSCGAGLSSTHGVLCA